MTHYRCNKIWTPVIASAISGMVQYFQQRYKMPIATREKIIITGANALATGLLTKHNDIILLLVGIDTHIHLLNLAVKFQKLLPSKKEPMESNLITNEKLIKIEPVPTQHTALPRVPPKTNQPATLPPAQLLSMERMNKTSSHTSMR